MELGGNDPFVVLEDADIDLAVKNAILSWLGNSGQACINAKWFIINSKVYEEFVSKLKSSLNEVVAGDPLDAKTFLGPLANKDQLDRLAS